MVANSNQSTELPEVESLHPERVASTASTASDTTEEANVHSAPTSRDQVYLERNAMTEPQAHHVRNSVVWAATLLTGGCVGCFNFLMVWACYFLQEWKLSLLQSNDASSPAARRIWLLLLINGSFAGVSAALVLFVAPVCAGGGMTEVKGFLNGSKIPGLFGKRTLLVRFVSTILAICSGLPIGREGPTISLGCNVGYLIARKLSAPFVKSHVELGNSRTQGSAAIIDEQRFSQAKRVGCTVGGAAGMAAIFHAPIGGLLYILEEVNMDNWAPELTFRTFVCSVLAVLVNEALMNLVGKSGKTSLIFYAGVHDRGWSWVDVPCFIVLAAAIGFFSRLYTRAMVTVYIVRGRMTRCCKRLVKEKAWALKLLRLGECVAFTAVVSCAFLLLAILVDHCHDVEPGTEDVVRLDCPEGQHNAVATLLLHLTDGSIQTLYTNQAEGHYYRFSSLMATLAGYVCFCVCIPGLPVPTGSFIPAMFVGALIGKAVGKLLFDRFACVHFAMGGTYAVMGSAAMLSAFTHQTLAIVVFLMECVNNIDFICPLMVTIAVARVVTKAFSEHGYDEEIMEIKGVPFLSRKPPHHLTNARATAAKLCAALPEGSALAPKAPRLAVERALKSAAAEFPVLSRGSGRCLGLVTRAHLENLLQEHDAAALETGEMRETPREDLLPISRIMDPAPWTVLPGMPAVRLYPLFARIGARAACVISSSGEFHGVLTRTLLAEAGCHGHGQEEQSEQSEAHTGRCLEEQGDDDEEEAEEDVEEEEDDVTERTTRCQL